MAEATTTEAPETRTTSGIQRKVYAHPLTPEKLRSYWHGGQGDIPKLSEAEKNSVRKYLMVMEGNDQEWYLAKRVVEMLTHNTNYELLQDYFMQYSPDMISAERYWNLYGYNEVDYSAED